MTKDELRELNRNTRDRDRRLSANKIERSASELAYSHLKFASLIKEKLNIESEVSK